MKTRIFIILAAMLICFTVKAQQNQSSGTKIQYGNNPAAGHFVKADDAKLYFEVYGNGPTIVLLHGGIMGSVDEMTEFIDKLKPNYQVIAMSTRGHGKSEIGTASITYERKAKDVMAVVNAVTNEKVIVLGFSDGAYTGYKVASMFPNRVNKLIAIGAGEQIPGLRKVVFSGEVFNPENEMWQEKRKLMPEPDRLEEFWRNMENFYNTMVASKDLFMSIQCPVLVMAGELDQNAPLPTVINAYNMIPNCQLSIIPNTGHVVFMQNFPAVWESLVPFLNNGK